MRPLIAVLLLCGSALAQTEGGTVTEISVAFLKKPGQYRTGLVKEDIRVAEDGAPQRVLNLEPAAAQPLCIALLIDNSGSNRAEFDKDGPKRLVMATNAALDWVRQTFSGTNDRAMVVNFNFEYFLDQPLTDSVPRIEAAMRKVVMRGRTAFYDALIAASEALGRDAGPGCRKTMVAITDAIDNSSKTTQGQAVGAVRRAGAELYVIGLRERYPVDPTRKFAESTGGAYFSATTPRNVRTAFALLEQDLSSRYRLTYLSMSPRNRRVAISVQLWDNSKTRLGKLTVLAPEFREVPHVP